MDESQNNNLINFADDKPKNSNSIEDDACWKVLIVDDEEEMHHVTKLVLSTFVFMNKKIKFFNAYSSEEARDILEQEDCIALILLDVVMREDDSGLKLVHYIRNELKNDTVRIILRTGQPGHAPENKVIIDYDINDYKEKTELSAQKLITTVVSSLRSYHHIMQIQHFNHILEDKVAKRTREIKEANRKLRETLLKLEEDEKAGKMVQSKFLPENNIDIKGYSFSYFYQPSLYLSGDFVEYFTIDQDNIGFYALDVSGHGVSSALVTAMIKFFFWKLLADCQKYGDDTVLSPAKLVSVMNQSFAAEELDKYFTIFYGVINVSQNTLSYINAGQYPYPLLLNGSDEVILEQKNKPVGLFEFAEYQDAKIKLDEKFELYIPSDGGFDILGELKLEEKLKRMYTILKALKGNVSMYSSELDVNDKTNLPDDVTLLMIKKGNLRD